MTASIRGAANKASRAPASRTSASTKCRPLSGFDSMPEVGRGFTATGDGALKLRPTGSTPDAVGRGFTATGVGALKLRPTGSTPDAVGRGFTATGVGALKLPPTGSTPDAVGRGFTATGVGALKLPPTGSTPDAVGRGFTATGNGKPRPHPAMRAMRSSAERRLFDRLSSTTTSWPAASSSTQGREPRSP